MRGPDETQIVMFSYIDLEQRVPKKIIHCANSKVVVDAILHSLSL